MVEAKLTRRSCVSDQFWPVSPCSPGSSLCTTMINDDRLATPIPSRERHTLAQCRCNVGAASATLSQHCTGTGRTRRIFRDRKRAPEPDTFVHVKVPRPPPYIAVPARKQLPHYVHLGKYLALEYVPRTWCWKRPDNLGAAPSRSVPCRVGVVGFGGRGGGEGVSGKNLWSRPSAAQLGGLPTRCPHAISITQIWHERQTVVGAN